MHQKIIAFFILFVLVFSCRGESVDDIQKIDQVLKIYIKNAAGKNLLNKKNPEAYYSIELKDLAALRDRVSISSSTKMGIDSTYYIEYVAGATRALQSNSTNALKIYKSDIAVQYKTSASVDIQEDLMELYYESTSQVFRLKTVNYKGATIFTKKTDEPNVITIVK